jgi:mono/diheme cytochrome c family protein
MHVKTQYLLLFLLASILILENCKRDNAVKPTNELPSGATKVDATAQRTGDATEGYKYLTTGDYISSGVPLEVYKLAYGSNNPDDLGRTGDNKGVGYQFNVITAFNGVKVVATTCLSCHADKLNGQIIVGLGSSTADNTEDINQRLNVVDNLVVARYGGKNSNEWKAYEPFSRGFHAVAPYIRTQTRGTNPATKIFAALSAHRDKNDLKWITNPQFTIPTDVYPSDVPAWWLMKKKNALYLNALGKGDHASLMMSASLVTLTDTADARKIDQKFPDVVAYLKSIKAPKYPTAIDQTLAQKGKPLFLENCSKCHGTYDGDGTYPNLLLDAATVGTDDALANAFKIYPFYHTWYNDSWFAKKSPKSQLTPTNGYIAPPLDGIWATAPYLHNGSVPTLEDLLNSTQRPKYWSRTFDNTADYDNIKIGWKYTVETSKTNINTYDTSILGYGNKGHYYGDKFTADERKSVIEYLKSL